MPEIGDVLLFDDCRATERIKLETDRGNMYHLWTRLAMPLPGERIQLLGQSFDFRSIQLFLFSLKEPRDNELDEEAMNNPVGFLPNSFLFLSFGVVGRRTVHSLS